MREVYAIYQNCLMALCLAAPFAALAAYGLCRLARSARMAGARRILAAILFAAPAIYLGATKGGHVTVNDAYIEDAGSYLTNDIAHIAIAKKTALLPDDTEILVYAREAASTNAADWARLSPYLAYSAHPYDYPLANATNYNVMVAANYTPPPTVHTNGVWVCYAGELWRSADATAYGLPASKIRTINTDPPTAEDYIQDGLIGMWDGIENAGYGVHEDNLTVWKDLTGNGYDFALHNTSVAEDGIEFNGSSSYAVITASAPNAAIKSAVFYEVIVSSAKAFQVPFHFGYYRICGLNWTYSRGPVICINNNGFNSQNSYSYWLPAWKSGLCSYTIDYANLKIYADGTLRSKAGSEYNGADNGYCYLGVRYYSGSISGWLNGRIASLRVYSRALTDEEREHNYEIDCKRFPALTE